ATPTTASTRPPRKGPIWRSLSASKPPAGPDSFAATGAGGGAAAPDSWAAAESATPVTTSARPTSSTDAEDAKTDRGGRTERISFFSICKGSGFQDRRANRKD